MNPPKKYYIETFGCQMNVHDSEKMEGILKGQGYISVDNPGEADLILFNTCSIRDKAEQKFFSSLGRLRRAREKRPGLKIGVAGCVAQVKSREIFDRMPHVDFVVGPQNLHRLPELLGQDACRTACEENPAIADMDLPAIRKDPSKAWVTVMYGCNNFCSYCIVPYTRGRERSRPAGHIIGEISALAEAGIREVTLLGQNVNSYASSVDFPDLLSKINEINGILRIRFVTSHPKDLSMSLIQAIRDLDKVCEHIHLPLQSGSSRILSLMNRKYSYDDYLHKVELLRSAVPDIAITSDIIAGFPGESDEDHSLTIKAIKEIGFDGIFAFNYSSRPGTRAAEMYDSVSQEVKAKRLNNILDIQNYITDNKNKLLEGMSLEIMTESNADETPPGYCMGRTRSNKIVFTDSPDQTVPGTILKTLITEARRHSLRGTTIY